MQKPYSSVNGAGLVLVAMDSLISLLQGMKLSSSSLENGLPIYCISVKMNEVDVGVLQITLTQHHLHGVFSTTVTEK